MGLSSTGPQWGEMTGLSSFSALGQEDDGRIQMIAKLVLGTLVNGGMAE